MAPKGGITPSGTPYEKRHRPSDTRKRKQQDALTLSDRLVCALCGGILGFALWTDGYFVLMYASARTSGRVITRQAEIGRPNDPAAWLPPFAWGYLVAAGCASFGAAVGPERMMDGFEKVMRTLGYFRRD